MPVRTKAEAVFKQNGYKDFRWLSGRELPVRQWVRFKCPLRLPQLRAACSMPAGGSTVG